MTAGAQAEIIAAMLDGRAPNHLARGGTSERGRGWRYCME